MQMINSQERYKTPSLSEYLPDGLMKEADRIMSQFGNDANEIRLRAGRPAVVMLTNGHRFIRKDIPVSAEEIRLCFEKICGYSVYSHQNDLAQGFITLPGGHRVGICGCACLDKSGRRTIRNISSINIRIASDHAGCSDGIFEHLYSESIVGTLIAGPPCSGKTTLLKDFGLKLSSKPFYQKTVLIDERDELAAMYKGEPCNAIGEFCDVLCGYPKGEGIMIAVRTLSPDVIICDEIGGKEDAQSVCDAINAGVVMIASAHACNVNELYNRRPIRNLLKSGAFQKIVLLRGGSARCEAACMMNLAEAEKRWGSG